MRRIVLILTPVVLLFAAAPSPAADHTVQVGDDFFQTPGSPDGVTDKISIATGDTIRWDWIGGSDAHHIVSRGTQIERWNSGERTSAGTVFRKTFKYAGRFRYQCILHPDTMQGLITVGTKDREKPTLKSVKVRVSGSTAKVSFKLSERSVVTLKAGGKKTSKALAKGKRSLRLKHLGSGRQKAKLTAKDGFGNTGRKSKRFAIG